MSLTKESAEQNSRLFFNQHVVGELEKQLHMGDQRGFFQNIKSVQPKETKKVESCCIYS